MSEVTRRLAGIMAADVVGYSAMVGVDEPGTLARVRALRAEIVEPLAAAHEGRVFKTTGDGFLAAFASAVQALRCAIAIQDALRARGDGLRLRIGVHQGEVVPEGDDLLGDGVIVAARLEPLAEPGGICISARVREDAAGKMALEVDDIGTPELKNIVQRIRVFRVRLGASEPPALALPDKPSLVVLPFQNLSGDPEQEYFADGMVDDITSALSRTDWLLVTGRKTAFTYKGRAIDLRQVGRELGVRYVLEGSIRTAAGRVRITCQLIEAAGGNHVWADRFDGELADIFELQDRITEHVVGAIVPSLQRAEIIRAIAKPTVNLDAYDCYLRAVPRFYANTKADLESAIALLRQALKIDPTYIRAKAFLAHVYCMRSSQGWDASGDQAGLLAVALARETLASGTNDPEALRCASIALSVFGHDYPAAFTAINRAVRLHPNSGIVLSTLGHVHCFANDPRPAIGHFHRSLALSPLDPLIGQTLSGLGLAHLLLGQNEEALPFLQRGVQEMPAYAAAHRHLIVGLVRLGRHAEARAAAALETIPGYRIGSGVAHYKNREYVAEVSRVLVQAGIPE